MTSKIRRSIALLTTTLLLLTFGAPAAFAQVTFDEADFNAYATGTNIHAFTVEQDGTRLLQADAGFTGAAAHSEHIGAETRDHDGGARDNDMDMRVHPDLPDQHTYARASALEGGLGVVVPDGPAEGTGFYGWSPLEDEEFATWDGTGERPGPMDASAPPTEHHANEAADIDLEEAAHAQVLYGEVFADWDDEACVPFLSEGFSEADDVRLLDAAGADDQITEEQWLAQTQGIQSYSGTYLGPQVDEDGNLLGDHAGVYAEARQTTESVTFFEGQEIEFTVTIDGPQVLRAVATGVEGGAYIEYEAPLVTVTQPEEEHLNIDVAGEGFTVTIPEDGDQLLAEISVFDEPYFQDVDADGTYAAAKADLVRVSLLGDPELGQAAEFRIGHMEVESEAPEGGIICEIPMEKTVEPQEVTAGDDFTFTIEVENPYDHCDVTARVVDEISVEEGDPSWTVTGTDPEADEVSDTRIVWEDVTIAAGETAEFTIFVTADEDSEDGVLRNDAWLEDALCEGMPLHGDAEVVAGMPVVGAAFVIGPGIGAAAVEPAVLPTTGGGNAAALLGLLLAAGALLLRGRRTGVPDDVDA